MEFYIGLGGISCRTLYEYQKQNNIPLCQCFFLDADKYALHQKSPDTQFYCVNRLLNRTGALRSFAKDAFKYEIFSGQLDSFFKPIFEQSDVGFTIITTSCGGFGSGVTVEIIDYLHAKCRYLHNDNNVRFKVLAFDNGFIESLPEFSSMREPYETNTIAFLTEMELKITDRRDYLSYFMSSNTFYFPTCDLFLINTNNISPNDFAKLINSPHKKLSSSDIQERYGVKPPKKSPSIFISYSSNDQTTADILVDSLEHRGFDCWISSRNINAGCYASKIIQGIRYAKVFIVLLSHNSIKSPHVKNEIDRAFSRLNDGLFIIPFIIDDSKINDDEEFEYYLCRQEFFNAKEPPIEIRINELIEKIEELIE